MGVVPDTEGADEAAAEAAELEATGGVEVGAAAVGDGEDAALVACPAPADSEPCPPQLPTGGTNGSDPIRCTLLPRFACGIASTSPLAGLAQPLPLLARNMSGKESNPSVEGCSCIRRS